VFVRVENINTGHQYDVDEDRAALAVERGAVRLLDDDRWPPTHAPRPAKPRTDLAGDPAPRRRNRPASQPAAVTETDPAAGDQHE
jgi:hypothetical protein